MRIGNHVVDKCSLLTAQCPMPNALCHAMPCSGDDGLSSDIGRTRLGDTFLHMLRHGGLPSQCSGTVKPAQPMPTSIPSRSGDPILSIVQPSRSRAGFSGVSSLGSIRIGIRLGLSSLHEVLNSGTRSSSSSRLDERKRRGKTRGSVGG